METLVGKEVLPSFPSPWRVISPTGRLTINEAEERGGELASLGAGRDDLALDLRGIEAIDVTGIQLLLALKLSVERQGRRIQLVVSPTGALLEVLLAGGFAEVQSGALVGALAGHTDSSSYHEFRDPFWRGGGRPDHG